MKKTVFSAVFTLSIFTIIDRILGFAFKIYLSRELGAETLGVYQVALSFFFVLLTATTSGIPLVVSKLTAVYRKRNERKKEYAATCAALVVGLCAATMLCALTLALYRPLKSAFSSEASFTVLLLLLPSLFFSAVYSAFRGNLWGREHYLIVSVVELIEQAARIVSCIFLIFSGVNGLFATAVSLSIGCFFSMLSVTICFVFCKGKLASPKGQLKPLIRSAAPITVSRAASSIVSSLNAVLVPYLLSVSGYSSSRAMELYGAGVSLALPLLYVPITVVGSLAFVMIPTVSGGLAENNYAKINRQIESAIGVSIVFTALFLPIFSALGKEIGVFLYDSADAGGFLSFSAVLLIPLAVENITSSIMNSLGLEVRSFFNYLIGSAVMTALMLCFAFNFSIYVLAVGMIVSQSLTCVLNVLAIRKKTGLHFSFVKKLLTSLVMAIPSTFMTKCVFSLCASMPTFFALAIACLSSAAFFIALSFALGLVDIDFFRSGTAKATNSGA